MSGTNPPGCPYLTWRKHRYIGNNDNYVGDICIGSKKKISIVLEKKQGAAAVILKHHIMIKPTDELESTGNGDNFKNLSFTRSAKLLRNNVFFTPPGGVLTLENAPDRILKTIFSFIGDAKTLSLCEMVCKTWRNFLFRVNCVKKKSTVSKMTFQSIDKIDVPRCVYVKKKRKEKGAYVDLKFYVPRSSSRIVPSLGHLLQKFAVQIGLGFIDVDVSRDLLAKVVRSQSKLTELRFLRCFVRENALSALSGVRSIKELSFDSCAGSTNSISNDELIPVIRRNELRSFELSGTSALTAVDNRLIYALVDTCQYNKFNYLKLSNCPKISTGPIADLANQYMRSAKRRFIIFLENTSFDTDRFLSTHKTFVLDPSNASTRRVELRAEELRIWVEKKNP